MGGECEDDVQWEASLGVAGLFFPLSLDSRGCFEALSSLLS